VVGELGELVITEPMPSMPLRFWNDEGDARYRETYFEPWPGVWRHGDWVEFSERGTVVIKGRSDSTLNRGGVRIGTAEIYAALGPLAEIADSLVLGVELDDGGYWMPLFVKLAPDATLDEDLVAAIRTAVRQNASPRHAPDEVIAVPAIPRTRTGKLLEVPLKRLFQGADGFGLDAGTVDDPAALDYFADLAARRNAA
jgi:acetoacetyl-CoA synthetase